MSKEAMKLALEALEYVYEGANNQGPHTGISWRCVSKKAEPAITALQKALANSALDRMAENARELGLDYEPAQQEPVATDWERIARVQDAKLRAMCNESGGFEKLCEVMDRYEHTSPQPAQQEPVAVWELFEDGWDSIADPEWMETLPVGTKLYTSPPAQRTWVGLTDEDVRQCSRDVVAGGSENSVDRFAYAIEAKLKEKNNG